MLQYIYRSFILTLLLSFFATANAKPLDAVGVIKAYKDWCAAIGQAQGKGEVMTKFYASHAILLPTLSAQILFNDKDELKDYFNTLTSFKDIKCTTKQLITEMIDENDALTAGYYDFTYTDQGKQVVIPARFTFVYQKRNNQWLVTQHHSSVVPASKK